MPCLQFGCVDCFYTVEYTFFSQTLAASFPRVFACSFCHSSEARGDGPRWGGAQSPSPPSPPPPPPRRVGRGAVYQRACGVVAPRSALGHPPAAWTWTMCRSTSRRFPPWKRRIEHSIGKVQGYEMRPRWPSPLAFQIRETMDCRGALKKYAQTRDAGAKFECTYCLAQGVPSRN